MQLQLEGRPADVVPVILRYNYEAHNAPACTSLQMNHFPDLLWIRRARFPLRYG